MAPDDSARSKSTIDLIEICNETASKRSQVQLTTGKQDGQGTVMPVLATSQTRIEIVDTNINEAFTPHPQGGAMLHR